MCLNHAYSPMGQLMSPPQERHRRLEAGAPPQHNPIQMEKAVLGQIRTRMKEVLAEGGAAKAKL